MDQEHKSETAGATEASGRHADAEMLNRIRVLEDLLWGVHAYLMHGEFDTTLAERLNAFVARGRWTEPMDTGHESPVTGDAAPPQIVAIEPVENCETELFAMLRQFPPLMAQLYDTLKAGRWLVTMHRKAKDSPPDDLLSDHTLKDFPIDEVVTVMQDHCRHILAEAAREIQALDGRAAQKPRWR